MAVEAVSLWQLMNFIVAVEAFRALRLHRSGQRGTMGPFHMLKEVINLTLPTESGLVHVEIQSINTHHLKKIHMNTIRFPIFAASAAVVALAIAAPQASANTLLWYRFDGDGATIENKAASGTMDGTLKSINTWGSLGGLGDTSSMFPTRGDAFPEGTRLIDPATDAIHSETVQSLSFTGDPSNSGVVRLLKADTTTAFKQMMSFTCEVFFKLPSDSAAIETRRAKDILFPLVDWGSPDGNGLGWFFGLRKDNSSTGFYPFFRSKHNNGSSAVQTDCQDKTYINDDRWHHLAVIVTADTSANPATVKLVLDYTTLATTKTLSSFYGFHNNNSGNFPFLVGADLWRSSKSCCFMGEIAEVRVSDTALAADQLLRPLPAGPVDADTLVYLPMGDCDWFGSSNTASYANIYHGVLNAAPTAACTPYWTYGTTSAAYPASAADAIGAAVRDGYFATNAFDDTKSMTFSRALVSGQYAGHALRIPYENAHLAEGSFTMEWFFKTDGQVPGGNGINSYTFLNNSFAKIMINQSNGFLLTRLVPAQGNYQDFNSTVRVDDGQWHHYALVYDKDQDAGVFAAYLDYRKIASKTFTLTTGTSGAFYFGGQSPTVQAFAGQLDDFRITKRAMKANEFLTTRPLVSGDSLFAHFDGDLSTGQDTAYAPDGVGGTLGGGSSAPKFSDHAMTLDLDGDGRSDLETTKALSLDGGSVVYPHNALLECRDFTVEWFAKYESLASNAMLLRFGMQSDDGTGSICWALYTPTDNLRLGAHVSSDGAWRNVYREDQNFATGAAAAIADGKWHHWALVAETSPDATPANTAFTLYKDYEQVGNTLVFDGENNAGGMLVLPSTGTTLSIGTGGSALNGEIDELRFRPGVQPVSSFMRRATRPFIFVVR